MEGRELAGRYRLRERVGAGGMGSVWRAWDAVLSRQVAVKLVDPALLDDPVFRERFRDEARAAAGLSHPLIVTVHDYGEDDGTPYIVMELLEGESLAGRLARGPLPPDEAARICAGLATALAAAHRAGIVHGDVKPANVFLTGGDVRILDFGLARAARDRPGPRLGTPAYAAPEQLDGAPATAASDVFALGVVLSEMLTGERPFAAGDSRSEPPPLLLSSDASDASDAPGVSPVLAGLRDRCLRADPARRLAAADVATALGVPSGPDVPSDVPSEAPSTTPEVEGSSPTLVLPDPAPAPRRPRLRARLTELRDRVAGDRVEGDGVEGGGVEGDGDVRNRFEGDRAVGDRAVGDLGMPDGAVRGGSAGAEVVGGLAGIVRGRRWSAGRRVPGDVPRRVPRGVVAGSVAVVAGVLVAVVVMVVLFPGGSDAPRATPSSPSSPSRALPATSPAASPASRPSRSPAPDAIGALTGLRRIVDEGAATGEVRADVAVDFGNLISALLDRLSTGEPVDVGQRVAELRRKVRERLSEGGLSPGRARQLDDGLSALSAPR